MRIAIPFILAALLLSGGCDRRPDIGAVVVSVVGGPPHVADSASPPLSESDRVVTGATAQGLVRFDAAGQVEPGLADQWIVIDDGRTYIFRLRRAEWPDGRVVTAHEVAAILKDRTAPGARNPYLPYLSAVESIVARTANVIEIGLSRPRPDLLKLFAQPELGLFWRKGGGGSGPFQIIAGSGTTPLLAPVADLDSAPDEEGEATPEDNVRLIGERTSRAIVRFTHRKSDLVMGGGLSDWPLAILADITPREVQRDPAAGLFGLAVVNRTGFLGNPANRAAIAQAIDRPALVALFDDNWPAAEQLLPSQLDSGAPPALAAWASLSRADRLTGAQAAVQRWRRRHPGELVLRLALPDGPGGTLLWGRLAADLLRIGAKSTRVGRRDPADLRLIDAVAPYDSARWYLATACVACGARAVEAIEAARVAETLDARAAAIAAADAAMAEDGGFIPIARPFRWSLVAARLRAWQPNARAWHPLNHLRANPK